MCKTHRARAAAVDIVFPVVVVFCPGTLGTHNTHTHTEGLMPREVHVPNAVESTRVRLWMIYVARTSTKLCAHTEFANTRNHTILLNTFRARTTFACTRAQQKIEDEEKEGAGLSKVKKLLRRCPSNR